MSPDLSPTSQLKPGRQVLGRLVGSVVVLAVEFALLSSIIDGEIAASRGGIWRVLDALGTIARLGVVAATALALLLPFARVRIESALPNDTLPLRTGWLVIHLLAALAAGLVAWNAFRTAALPPGPPWVWLLLGFCLPAVAAVALPLSFIVDWRRLLRAWAPILTAASGVGIVGVALATWSERLWNSFTRMTFDAVVLLFNVFGGPVTADAPNATLALGGFLVSVQPQCSGFEGIGLYMTLISAFLFAAREQLRFPVALWVIPVGVIAVWLGNVFRIAALMWIGAFVSPQMAIGGFHSKAGWILFCGTTVAMAFLVRRWCVAGESGLEPELIEDNPAAQFLMPICVWVGTGLVSEAFSVGIDEWYWARVSCTLIVLWHFRGAYREFITTPSPRALLVGIGIGLAWLWFPADGHRPGPPQAWPELKRAAWLFTRTVGSVVVVPMVEELAFRGFLLRRFSSPRFWEVQFSQVRLLGIAGSSLAFGVVHQQWVLATLTGVVLAALSVLDARAGTRIRPTHGSLSDCIAAHGVANAMLSAAVLCTERWSYW